jgi:hypothetical protein
VNQGDSRTEVWLFSFQSVVRSECRSIPGTGTIRRTHYSRGTEAYSDPVPVLLVEWPGDCIVIMHITIAFSAARAPNYPARRPPLPPCARGVPTQHKTFGPPINVPTFDSMLLREKSHGSQALNRKLAKAVASVASITR